MQDPRMRIGSVMALSAAAFISVTGAVLVLLWWLVFTKRLESIRNKRIFGILIVFLVATGGLVSLSGGSGPDYILKMVVIFIIAAWIYSTYLPGEFMSFSVWLLGERTGFETGMIAEMAVISIDDIIRDFQRIRTAMRIKEERFSASSVLRTGITLIARQLERADEQARILKVRGYDMGGRYIPKFQPDLSGILGFSAAILILIVSILSFSDIFIVLH